MGKPASDRGFWSKRRIPSSTRSSKPSPKAFACPPAGSSLRASSPRTKPSGNCLPRSWRWATIQRSLTEKAAGRRPADPFFHVAARLIYEQTRLVLPPCGGYRSELADRLEKLNRDRAASGPVALSRLAAPGRYRPRAPALAPCGAVRRQPAQPRRVGSQHGAALRRPFCR